MKQLTIIIFFLAFYLTSSAQNADQEKEMRETISWINKQFRDNSIHKTYTFKEIVFIEGEPIMDIIKSPGTCSENDEIERIPIRKIKSVRFEETISPVHEYRLFFETKNGEEIIWFQSKDKKCGQIGDYTFAYLNDTIEQNNLIARLKSAFSYLMKLYDNDGKEKF